MSEVFGKKENEKQMIKDLIRELHAGAKPDEVKEKFKEVLKGIGPTDIARIEEELIKEGLPREEIHRLCDVHLAVFKERLEREKTLVSPGHPIHTLMEEHKILLQFSGKLKNTVEEINVREKMKELSHIAEHFKEAEKHYLREENVLFPYLEKHGITQPPAMMWSEHNEIRKKKKKFYELLDSPGGMNFPEFVKKLRGVATAIEDILSSHFYKENNILFPTALKVISEKEWSEIRKQCDEIGYCCFTPKYARGVAEPLGKPAPEPPSVGKDKILFETGHLSIPELEVVLNTLPVDITFVDKEDRVRYFSQSKERIFPRTKAVIGRRVQQCHPQKSLHVVEQILNDFKNNKRNVAEFWINLKGRLIHIRYFAVRDKNGDYLGCLEVTQDITNIKKIEGEKRLLQ
jgi:hypothetical protein